MLPPKEIDAFALDDDDQRRWRLATCWTTCQRRDWDMGSRRCSEGALDEFPALGTALAPAPFERSPHFPAVVDEMGGGGYGRSHGVQAMNCLRRLNGSSARMCSGD